MGFLIHFESLLTFTPLTYPKMTAVQDTMVRCEMFSASAKSPHLTKVRTRLSPSTVFEDMARIGKLEEAEEAARPWEGSGRVGRAGDVLLRMEQEGSATLARTYQDLLQACVRKKALADAKLVQAHMVKMGMDSNLFLAESLVNALVKCGSLVDAVKVFERLSDRRVFAWTAIITGCTNTGQGREALGWYRRMKQEGVQPNRYTFVTLLRACGGLGDLDEGKRVHAEVVQHGCEQDLFVGTALVDMYARCGSMVEAQHVFDKLVNRDVAVWTAMISGYSQLEQGEKVFQLYSQMLEEDVRPNDRTLVRVLQACCSLAAVEKSTVQNDMAVKVESLSKGLAVHAEAVRMGYGSDSFVGSTLVHMYAMCGSMRDAQRVFDMLPENDVVSWTALITGYAQLGQGEKALQLYARMRDEGVMPNERTIMSALKACVSLAEMEVGTLMDGQCLKKEALEKGKAIHAEAVSGGHDSDCWICSSLVSMYAKCGSLDYAFHLFEALPERDVVAWTAMISGCAEQQRNEKALDLYARMQMQGLRADEATFLCILRVCSSIGSVNICHRVHQDIVQGGYEHSILVGNALVHAYGKCGSMVCAQQVFDLLPRQDIFAWTALIAGYARQAQCEESLQCFEQMQQSGVPPNGVTFLALISACSYGGLIEKGLEYFDAMSRDHGIHPTLQHYTVMVDLLGRSGLLSQAEDMLLRMPWEPDLAVWSSLLSACRNHGNPALGRRCFEGSIRLAPKEAAAYVLMSHIYADAGMFDAARDVDELRRRAGAWKEQGRCWIEHEQKVHVFTQQERKHNQGELTLQKLRDLQAQLKRGGYLYTVGR